MATDAEVILETLRPLEPELGESFRVWSLWRFAPLSEGRTRKEAVLVDFRSTPTLFEISRLQAPSRTSSAVRSTP